MLDIQMPDSFKRIIVGATKQELIWDTKVCQVCLDGMRRVSTVRGARKVLELVNGLGLRLPVRIVCRQIYSLAILEIRKRKANG